MRGKIRNAPSIPDHEVLRKIGGGSYGEVWMARTVTEVYRAVKVVWRDDFENDRDFEREFEGILNYEPISRNHPGLIPILHVGRTSGEEDFYYYVMELADDVESGQEFHPVEYTPRTLRKDLKQADGTPIDVDSCLDLGVKMGEALDYLHGQSLAHRDMKPANVVFHNYEPKLADIGLVAMPGQRTFVGTEGFVPPEGPGTRRADIYSLGKVLYEMATGMDRLDFPNLPDYDFPSEKAKRWRLLNTLICDVCDPRENHRDVKRAPDLIKSLKRIQAGKKLKKPLPKKLKTTLTLLPILILLGIAGVSYFSDSENGVKQISSYFNKEYAPVKILSTPNGAEVWTTTGEFLGTTPLAGREEEVGIYKQYEFRLPGYSNTLAGGVVSPTGIAIEAELPVFAPPEIGETWTDLQGILYQPVNDTHISSQFINKWSIRKFLKKHSNKPIQHAVAKMVLNDISHDVVLMTEENATLYCNWLTEECIKEGYLTEEFIITPIVNPTASIKNAPEWTKKNKLHPFNCKVERIPYASIILYVNVLDDITFYIDNQEVIPQLIPGAVIINRIRPGERSLKIEAEGYREAIQKVSLEDLEVKDLKISLKPDRSVIFDKKWDNSLSISMTPIGDNLMVAVHETTVKTYWEYRKATQKPFPRKPTFKQSETHPVVNISRKEATEFCQWLTMKERKQFFIGKQHTYRLPTDQEWSTFAGLNKEEGDTPSERDVSTDNSYYWGSTWIPKTNSGNFADESLALEVEYSANRSITGYLDNFPFTSPVGQFNPNQNGVYDLAGNVYEWVSDSFGLGDYGVTRGGSWRTYQKENLYCSFRNALKPHEKNAETGFRIVLSKE